MGSKHSPGCFKASSTFYMYGDFELIQFYYSEGPKHSGHDATLLNVTLDGG